MDEIDAWILAGMCRRGEWFAMWVSTLGAFIEFNYPGGVSNAN